MITLSGIVRRLFETRLLSCDVVAKMISDRLDGAGLSFTETLKLRLHLRICRWCQRYLDQVNRIHEAAQNHDQRVGDADEVLSAEERVRLQSLLDADSSDTR